MYLKSIILLLILTIFTTNASILLWSKLKFQLNPLEKFENEEFLKLIQNLDKPQIQIYKTNSLNLSKDHQMIFRGFNTGYSLNGEINTENATEISGNGDQLDLEKIKINPNNDQILYAIVIPHKKHNLNKRDLNKNNDQSEIKTTTSTTTTTSTSASTTTTVPTSTTSTTTTAINDNIQQLPPVGTLDNPKVSTSTNGPVFYKAKGKNENYGLLYSTKSLKLTLSNTTYNLGNTSNDMITVDQTPRISTSNRLNIKFIDSDNNKILVSFIFYWLHGYWYLNTVKITYKSNQNYFYLSENITAPPKFSYHCSDRIVFKDLNNSENKLYLYDIQIQIDSINGKFNDAYDCVNFITAPIWSSLFVTGLFGLGLIISLIAIMDIKTMDKFDNYKTKQLSITVAE